MNEKRDKTQYRGKAREGEGESQGGDRESRQREETERERYGEQGRLIEQLKDEERAAWRGGEEEIWFGK